MEMNSNCALPVLATPGSQRFRSVGRVADLCWVSFRVMTLVFSVCSLWRYCKITRHRANSLRCIVPFTTLACAIPVAVSDSATVLEEGNITFDIRSNDTDADTATASLSVTNLSTPANGTVNNDGNGMITYTHNGSETTSDTFTYTINDDAGGSDTGTVTMTVTPVNDKPIATADSGTVAENGSTTFDIRANDSDAETPLASLTVTNLSVPDNGTVVSNNNGIVTYTHDGSETTSDSFTYTINDGIVDSNIVTVSMTITAVNNLPIATADNGTVAEGTSIILSIALNDTDTETPNANLTITNLSATTTTNY